LYDHLKELRDCDDIGEGGLNVVRCDMDRCCRVLVALDQADPESRATVVEEVSLGYDASARKDSTMAW
jgi:hypothetical protein